MTEHGQRRPLIYVTLGTIFNRSEAVMARLIEGAGETDADVLVTVGENGRVPASTPSNVTVERYVPQTNLYPHLAAVVCHGGSEPCSVPSRTDCRLDALRSQPTSQSTLR
jgi:UDP:flavonoid glycosyltransferase YjiC (YdhE family)